MHLFFAQAHRGQHHHLVPGHIQSQAQRRIRIPPKLQHDWPSAVHHEIEPPVVASHGEALVGPVGRDPHPDESHAVGGDDFPAYDSGTAARKRDKKPLYKKEYLYTLQNSCVTQPKNQDKTSRLRSMD